ncbi:hypothetical protein BC938DRAFT_480290 [Jimgerdemannia flammicorona]|uniref:Uncharacterized protein n=1 Tax=Jimgerdemannia flammicorona TaxID=994334 RepID=A0A433QIU0_9FUNG|nr:hypothetical protein BC938DRAFT_480290 [Jimgerdemannia flammicorona]
MDADRLKALLTRLPTIDDLDGGSQIGIISRKKSFPDPERTLRAILKELNVPQLEDFLVWIPPSADLEPIGNKGFAMAYAGNVKDYSGCEIQYAMKELNISMVPEVRIVTALSFLPLPLRRLVLSCVVLRPMKITLADTTSVVPSPLPSPPPHIYISQLVLNIVLSYSPHARRSYSRYPTIPPIGISQHPETKTYLMAMSAQGRRASRDDETHFLPETLTFIAEKQAAHKRRVASEAGSVHILGDGSGTVVPFHTSQFHDNLALKQIASDLFRAAQPVPHTNQLRSRTEFKRIPHEFPRTVLPTISDYDSDGGELDLASVGNDSGVITVHQPKDAFRGFVANKVGSVNSWMRKRGNAFERP